MPEGPSERRSLRVSAGQPLIGVVERKNGGQVTRYFTEDSRRDDQTATEHRVRKAPLPTERDLWWPIRYMCVAVAAWCK